MPRLHEHPEEGIPSCHGCEFRTCWASATGAYSLTSITSVHLPLHSTRLTRGNQAAQACAKAAGFK